MSTTDEVEAIRKRHNQQPPSTATMSEWKDNDTLLSLYDQLRAEHESAKNWLIEANNVAKMFHNFSWPDRMSFSEAVAEQVSRLSSEVERLTEKLHRQNHLDD